MKERIGITADGKRKKAAKLKSTTRHAHRQMVSLRLELAFHPVPDAADRLRRCFDILLRAPATPPDNSEKQAERPSNPGTSQDI